MESRIVIVHSDKSVRRALEAMCTVHHQAVSAPDVKTGLKMILKIKPVMVVVGLETAW